MSSWLRGYERMELKLNGSPRFLKRSALRLIAGRTVQIDLEAAVALYLNTDRSLAKHTVYASRPRNATAEAERRVS